MYKYFLMVSFITISFCMSVCAEIELARDQKTEYVIIKSQNATPAERFAVEELQNHLTKVTGASFKVISESDTIPSAYGIYVGQTKFAQKHGIDGLKLGDEEWVIKSIKKDLVLTGGRPRGTLYAVYEFLEQKIGCHWFDELTSTIPFKPNIVLNKLNIRGQPTFWARQIYTGTGESIKTLMLRARNKDTRATLSAKLGFGHGEACHTFYAYAKKFPANHPEYLAMDSAGNRPVATNGAGPGQICLTHPEVRKLMLQQLKAKIVENRKVVAKNVNGRKVKRIYFISPNDVPWSCQCTKCKELSKQEGSDSGLLLDFVNYLADGVKDEYPNILIGTDAYANNVRVPKTVRPHDNVVIRMAQLNAEWGKHSKDKDEYPDLFRPMNAPVNRKACETLMEWSKIARHMSVWDYWIQYSGNDKFPSPYVNTQCLQPDLKLFRDCKVERMFVECESPETTSFFALKCWLGWKLMQNPNQKKADLIKTFMKGFYGPAAKKMTEYLNYMEKQINAVPQSKSLSAMTTPERPYLDLEFYKTCQQMLDEAVALCKKDTLFMLNVNKERIPVDAGIYCMWEKLKKQLPAGQKMPWKPKELLKRYENNRLEQLKARYFGTMLKNGIAALKKEIMKFREIAACRDGLKPPFLLVPKQVDGRAAGNPSKVDWNKSAKINQWYTLFGKKMSKRGINGAFTHDGKYLYISLQETNIDTSKLSKKWWAGDGWELFFTSQKGGEGRRQLAINPEGEHFAYDYANGQNAWDSGAVIKSDTHDKSWKVLISIPLDKLVSNWEISQPFYANIFRTTPSPGVTMCLSPIYEAQFHDMARLAELTLELDWPDKSNNLAFSKSYTLNAKPNYRHCKNTVRDLQKLTDDKFAKIDPKRPIWFDKQNTLGFCGVSMPVEITVDLEDESLIENVIFHTVAGSVGCEPPKCIKVYASKDGKKYLQVGEEKREATGQSGYRMVTIRIPVKKIKARYIRIAVQARGDYLFCDEIAITGKRDKTR